MHDGLSGITTRLDTEGLDKSHIYGGPGGHNLSPQSLRNRTQESSSCNLSGTDGISNLNS